MMFPRDNVYDLIPRQHDSYVGMKVNLGLRKINLETCRRV